MSVPGSVLRPVTLSRFRGALLGALMGDCFGAEFEGQDPARAATVIRTMRRMEEERGSGTLEFTDDTAMARSVVQSLLANQEFDEVDMAKRFAEEYLKEPDRGYGMGVVTVFKKLLTNQSTDVFEPAREQFEGKGSYGNGAAMRVVGIPLAYPDITDVKKFAKISGQLTHAASLGYNGGILQALAVHYALQGEPSNSFLDQLISNMEAVEGDDKSLADAKELDLVELPFTSRLKKVKEFVERGQVLKDDVISELGTGIAALESVPTAIYSFLRCMNPDPDIPEEYNSLQRTIIYCISLGGDTDTIATMAGAIAGAYYGEELVPSSWKQSCEGHEDAEKWAEELHELYSKRCQGTATV